jgi:hypothetical protein
MQEIIIGEDRELLIDLRDVAGAALIVTGWSLQLRLGSRSRQLRRALEVTATPGRVRCELDPPDLEAVGAGTAEIAVWRVDSGSTYCVAEGTVEIRRTI